MPEVACIAVTRILGGRFRICMFEQLVGPFSVNWPSSAKEMCFKSRCSCTVKQQKYTEDPERRAWELEQVGCGVGREFLKLSWLYVHSWCYHLASISGITGFWIAFDLSQYIFLAISALVCSEWSCLPVCRALNTAELFGLRLGKWRLYCRLLPLPSHRILRRWDEWVHLCAQRGNFLWTDRKQPPFDDEGTYAPTKIVRMYTRQVPERHWLGRCWNGR
jgi:hypothetical protein